MLVKTNCFCTFARKLTDEHWTRNWKRAPLVWELSNEKENNDELEIDRR